MPSSGSTIVQELAVLRSLASFGCATMQQLHKLCFPEVNPVTVRTRLRGLLDAGWITHTVWQLSRAKRARGQVWTITRSGLELLSRYDRVAPPGTVVDLGRPSTSLECEEWEARIGVRSLIVQLILEARRRPLLARLRVRIPPLWPTLIAPGHIPTPDAELQIGWEEPTQQARDWLPWSTTDVAEAQVDTYAVYLDRSSLGTVALTLDRWLTTTPNEAVAALLVWVTDARLAEACRRLNAVSSSSALRMTSWSAVDRELDGGWRDAAGNICSLRLGRQDTIGRYHNVPAA